MEAEVDKHKSKCKKFKLQRKLYRSLLRTFTTDNCLKFLIKEHDAARSVMERVARMFKNARPAKDKVGLCKCIKWVLVCINKCRRLVINAPDRARLSDRAANARLASAKKSYRRKK